MTEDCCLQPVHQVASDQCMHPTSAVTWTSPLLLYIGDLPKTIVRSFLHIYAEDANIYGSISKRLDEQKLVSDLLSSCNASMREILASYI